MKKLLLHIGYFFSLSCSFSLLAAPITEYPNYNYDECGPANECCSTNDCCSTSGRSKTNWVGNALLVTGAAVLGGLAGAAISNGGHHHHRERVGPAGVAGATGATGLVGGIGATGASGATGATGAGPFNVDTGESLTFILSGLFPEAPGASLTLIPFVTAPDGMTYEGASIVVPPTGGTVNFEPIFIEDPIYGYYNLGVNVINSGGPVAGVMLSGSAVEASRRSSATTGLLPLVGVSLGSGQSQFGVNFTYGPDNVP